jgi:DNA-directed RNA polymerase I, II, and III subunit RPABC2
MSVSQNDSSLEEVSDADLSDKNPTNDKIILKSKSDDSGDSDDSDDSDDTDESGEEKEEEEKEEVIEDSSEYSDDDNFQKLENELDKKNLLLYHPELLHSSYKEIKALSRVVRDKNGIIIDPLHRTIPFLTKYERARILGIRAKQLNYDADPFVEVPTNMISGSLIALKELEEKKLPFIIRRPLPNGGNEFWKLSDLELINY